PRPTPFPYTTLFRSEQCGKREEADRGGGRHRARLARRHRLAIGDDGYRRGACTMAMRSWLFVPGDSDAKLGKVAGYGSDVVIVEDRKSTRLNSSHVK